MEFAGSKLLFPPALAFYPPLYRRGVVLHAGPVSHPPDDHFAYYMIPPKSV